MGYVVTEKCIKCKYQDCIAVCPVNCFYHGEVMLVINPDECIDCGACEPVCTAQAIVFGDTNDGEAWLDLNLKYSNVWPNITRKGETPTDADSYNKLEGQYQKYFSASPGKSVR